MTDQISVAERAQVGPMWDVMHVSDGMSARGDLAEQELKVALAHGWEPFTVAGGRIWLRKKING